MVIRLTRLNLLFIVIFSALGGALFIKLDVINYFSYLWKRKKNTPVVRARNKTLATLDDINNLFSVMSKFDQNMSFLMFFPREEQTVFYKKLINDYIINSFLIEKYIKDNNIDEKEGFKSYFKQYMNIMKSSFYNAFLREYLLKNIVIGDQDARNFYESHQQSRGEFLNPPFIKKVPGIDGRAIKIDAQNNDKEVLKKKLINNEQGVLPLERINKSSRCSSILSCALSTMKDGEFEEVALENGNNFLIYRVKEYPGEWADFDDVAVEVKSIMQNITLDEQMIEILEKLRQEYEIVLDEETLQNYIDLLMAAQNPINSVAVVENDTQKSPQ